MSRKVIQDLIIPLVERIASKLTGGMDIRDPHLESYLEEQLKAIFGLAGSNSCPMLRTYLEDARRRDPQKFEDLIRRLVKDYFKLRTVVRPLEPVVSPIGDKTEEVRAWVRKRRRS